MDNNIILLLPTSQKLLFIGDSNKHYCACGCGEEILYKLYYKYRGWPKYKLGHYWPSFENGHKSWSKGLTKDTDKRLAKMANSLIGSTSWAKGLTKETDPRIMKISEKLTGKKGHLQSDITRKKMSLQRLGKKHKPISDIGRQNMSLAHMGVSNGPKSEKAKLHHRIGALKRIFKLVNDYDRCVSGNVGNHEKLILDAQEKLTNDKILRQFTVVGYIVDGYCKETNTVYEVDEKNHFNIDGTLKEKDIIRQKRIEDALKCKFIRIRIDKNGERVIVSS